MSDEKKMQVIFAPGCFDHFEGTQEELDDLIAHITEMVESGELIANSQPMTEEEFEAMSPEEQEIFIRQLEIMDQLEEAENQEDAEALLPARRLN